MQNRDFDNIIRCLTCKSKITCNEEDGKNIKNLQPYFISLKPTQKRPDAYSVIDDNILVLEHFQFDNSKSTKKGSNQNLVSAETDRQLKIMSREDNEVTVMTEFVSRTGKYYIDNFKQQFTNHAKNIEGYKLDIQKELKKEFNKWMVGFIIEDASFLGSLYRDSNLYCVDLTTDKEFLDLFEQTKNLDFVIFSMTNNQDAKIFSFLSRECINKQRKRQIEVSKIERFLSPRTRACFSL